MGSATLQQRCQRKVRMAGEDQYDDAVLDESIKGDITKEYESSTAKDDTTMLVRNNCGNEGIISRKPKYDADVRAHDLFNIVVLVPLNLLNMVNWDWDSALSGRPSPFVYHWTGEYFDVFWWTTCLYFVMDLLWVVLIPAAVKSPSVIIWHHLIVLMYIMVPFLYPKTRWCMGACMSVELNTWFLIARRYFKDDRSSPRYQESSAAEAPRSESWKDVWLRIGFYTTWVVIRMILYPLLVIVFCHEFVERSMELGRFVNVMIIAPIIQVVLVILNLRWSWDLFVGQRHRSSKGPQKEGL